MSQCWRMALTQAKGSRGSADLTKAREDVAIEPLLKPDAPD